MSYHGTITRWGQAFDELAIIYWELALLYTVLEQNEITKPWIKYFYIPFGVFETILYSQMDKYPTIGWALYHPLHSMVDIVVVYFCYKKCVSYNNEYGMKLIQRGLVFILHLWHGCWISFGVINFMIYIYTHLAGIYVVGLL